MKHVAYGETLRSNNRPCFCFHSKQNVSFQRPLRQKTARGASP
jgi:hypothetical protein